MVPGRVKEFVDAFLHLESHEIFAGYYSLDPGVKESLIENFCSFIHSNYHKSSETKERWILPRFEAGATLLCKFSEIRLF